MEWRKSRIFSVNSIPPIYIHWCIPKYPPLPRHGIISAASWCLRVLTLRDRTCCNPKQNNPSCPSAEFVCQRGGTFRKNEGDNKVSSPSSSVLTGWGASPKIMGTKILGQRTAKQPATMASTMAVLPLEKPPVTSTVSSSWAKDLDLLDLASTWSTSSPTWWPGCLLLLGTP